MRNLRPIIIMLALGAIISGIVWHYSIDWDIEDAWFQLGQGSGMHGLETVKVATDGRALFVYGKDSGGWALQRFQVAPEVVEALKRKIDELGIAKLSALQVNHEIVDGTQWVVLIKGQGPPTRIYCSNKFPRPLSELAEYVHKQIVQPSLIDSAERLVPSRHARNYSRELWDSVRNVQ